jgi:hypothetical protein
MVALRRLEIFVFDCVCASACLAGAFGPGKE